MMIPIMLLSTLPKHLVSQLIGLVSVPNLIWKIHINTSILSVKDLQVLSFQNLWAIQPNNDGVNEDCVSVLQHSSSGLKWTHIQCDENILAICELNVEEACGAPKHTDDVFCD